MSWALTPAQEVSPAGLSSKKLFSEQRSGEEFNMVMEKKNCVKFMGSFFPMSDPSVTEEIRAKLCLYFLSSHKSLCLLDLVTELLQKRKKASSAASDKD